MGLVIPKKITLEFLGDEYKDAYLIFKSIPITQLADMKAKMPNGDAEDDKLKVIPIMLDILKEQFLRGEFPDLDGKMEPVQAEDLDNLDANTAIQCFQTLSGVTENLDSESRSSSTPSTQTESPEQPRQTNS